jgi:hypothetical protein
LETPVPALVPLFVSGIADKAADLALNCLAVAGGYLVGFLFGAAVAWALDRWAFAHKTPEPVKKGIAILAGIAVAVLVALLVFGKGSGSGGGSGDGTGKNAGSPSDAPADAGKQAPPPRDTKTPPPKIEPTPSPRVEPDAPQIKVTFLGGDAVSSGERFYLIDESGEKRHTFDEVKAAIEKKKQEAGSRQLILVVQYPSDPKLAADAQSRTVSQVKDWAKSRGVDVIDPGKK